MEQFPRTLAEGLPRVLKQHRGNGGIGVWKVQALDVDPTKGAFASSMVRIQHAAPRDGASEDVALSDLLELMRPFFNGSGHLIDQAFATRVSEGMVLVSAMHITAGIYVNDHESGLIADIDKWLEELAPFRKDYQHHDTGEDNGDSHLKALLIHHQVIVPITNGRLDLGTWQRVFYAEFDGQRDKRVILKVMGE